MSGPKSMQENIPYSFPDENYTVSQYSSTPEWYRGQTYGNININD